MKTITEIPVIILLLMVSFAISCGQTPGITGRSDSTKGSPSGDLTTGKKYKVTFIELGSVRCIPCQQMQSVMKSVEAKYGKEVKITFHDVWTEEGKPYGVTYGIEAIPTQVFLDANGKEYYRHVGFFPEEELVKILQMKGVKAD